MTSLWQERILFECLLCGLRFNNPHEAAIHETRESHNPDRDGCTYVARKLSEDG